MGTEVHSLPSFACICRSGFWPRESNSVYSSIAQSRRCSMRWGLVPDYLMQWPCPLVMWDRDPLDEPLILHQWEWVGHGGSREEVSLFLCASLCTEQGSGKTVCGPVEMMSTQTGVFVIHFHFRVHFLGFISDCYSGARSPTRIGVYSGNAWKIST